MIAGLQQSPRNPPRGQPPEANESVADAELTEASFFAVPMHFDRLAIRAHAMASRRVMLRAWCCNGGSGEEAYSIAMLLREAGCLGEVLATDPDPEAVAAGRRGMYPLATLTGLGADRLQRHFFVRGADDQSRVALVRGELRTMVAFSGHQVYAADWPAAGRFDVIFCRRGLGSADSSARRLVIGRLVAALAPEGTLYLGQAEGVNAIHPALLSCGGGVYERRASGS